MPSLNAKLFFISRADFPVTRFNFDSISRNRKNVCPHVGAIPNTRMKRFSAIRVNVSSDQPRTKIMKKLLYHLLFLHLSVSAYAQIDEAKLTLNNEQLNKRALLAVPADKDCCNCANNIFKDGGFEKLSVGAQGNITASSGPWTVNTRSPQWHAGAAACNNGFIAMWGNKVVGESVRQTNPFVAKKQYQGKFMARFLNGTAISKSVQLEILIDSSVVYTSPAISNTNWACYTIPPFTAPAGASVILRPTNQYSQNDGAYVSWIQVDSICIEEACNCDKLPKDFKIAGETSFCKPKVCDTDVKFAGPALDAKCYKYTWQVSLATTITGQGTHQISLPCKELKTGNYEIKLSITCNGKTVSGAHKLTVCAKPDPIFSLTTSGASVSVSSSVQGTHYWYLVEDNDNSCSYTTGDVVTNPGGVQANPTAFYNLTNNKQYMVYHIITSKCTEQQECWSLQVACFKYLPALNKSASGDQAPTATVQKIKELDETNFRGYPIPRPPYRFADVIKDRKASEAAPSKALKIPTNP